MILITHDLGVVAEICDKVAIMYAGRVVEYADKESLYLNPIHPYTNGLFRSVPAIDEDVDELPVIPGLMPDPMDLPKGCAFHPRCAIAEAICAQEQPKMCDFGNGHCAACHVMAKRHGL